MSLIRTGAFVSISSFVVGEVASGAGSSGYRTPRSIAYGKWMSPEASSKMPMSTTWASKISWILSPTTS